MYPSDPSRRYFIGGMVALLSSSALAIRPESAFTLSDYEKSIAELVGDRQARTDEESIQLKAPEIAENGAQVRVEVEVSLPNVESISLLVEKNPVPLTSQFVFSGDTIPYVSVNLKVRETSEIMALVKADGQFYSAVKSVRVTAGGCG